MKKYKSYNKGYSSKKKTNVNSKLRTNNKNKRKNASRVSSILATILIVASLLACVGGVVHFFRGKNNTSDNNVVVNEKIVYFVPGDEWSSDASGYGAWCWSESSLPASRLVLGTDENEDGTYEFKIPDGYTSLLFVDLKPEATQLGLNWENVRAQTTDLVVPTDENVYYHQYASEWTANSNMLYNVTTEEIDVFLDNEYAFNVNPVVYCFDKTGKTDAVFIGMAQIGSSNYAGTIPAGYTHIIFIEYSSEEFIDTWDGIINQTSDLIIPIGEANHFSYATMEWTIPATE